MKKADTIFWIDLKDWGFMAGRWLFCWRSPKEHSCVFFLMLVTTWCALTLAKKRSTENHRQKPVWLHLDGWQFKCLDSCRIPFLPSFVGVQTMVVPWANGIHWSIYWFEIWPIDLLLETRNQTQIAKLLRDDFQIIMASLKRTVAWNSVPLPISWDKKS